MEQSRTKLTVIVEIAMDGTYGCYPADIDKDIGLSGYGATAHEAIEDFLSAYKETKEDNEKMGIKTPEYEFEYKYDMRAFFNYFNFFNVSRIAEMAGINNAQLNQYLTGKRNASKIQYEKLAKCVSKITNELQMATF